MVAQNQGSVVLFWVPTLVPRLPDVLDTHQRSKNRRERGLSMKYSHVRENRKKGVGFHKENSRNIQIRVIMGASFVANVANQVLHVLYNFYHSCFSWLSNSIYLQTST